MDRVDLPCPTLRPETVNMSDVDEDDAEDEEASWTVGCEMAVGRLFKSPDVRNIQRCFSAVSAMLNVIATVTPLVLA